eukprot:3752418-Rhodomonas_salina.2
MRLAVPELTDLLLVQRLLTELRDTVGKTPFDERVVHRHLRGSEHFRASGIRRLEQVGSNEGEDTARGEAGGRRRRRMKRSWSW